MSSKASPTIGLLTIMIDYVALGRCGICMANLLRSKFLMEICLLVMSRVAMSDLLL